VGALVFALAAGGLSREESRVLGLLYVLVIYAVVFALHLAVPGQWVDGYVIDPKTNKPLRYRLNGLRVFLLSLTIWAFLCSRGVLPWEAFYDHRWEMVASACGLGLIFSALIVFTAPKQPGSNPFADFYLGRLDNPQALGGKVDAKMWLYLIGATMLGLNLASFAAAHLRAFPNDPSPGVLVSCGFFAFFLVEYLNFEEVHLYTYDFMAEKVGFKLGWGCLTFYPFFYAVGMWNEAERPNPHTHPLLLVACAVMFFGGWSFARGANMQKFHFKRDPTRKFLGMTPVALEGRVLVSGFWGLSRHINYLGELLMASAITLALGYGLTDWQPWLYPLYYVALFIPRQLDDDKRCAKKYGPLWVEYKKRVPYRIIPYVF
jgi:Ergosterol biosynthesis ERG4/ERG24 family